MAETDPSHRGPEELRVYFQSLTDLEKEQLFLAVSSLARARGAEIETATRLLHATRNDELTDVLTRRTFKEEFSDLVSWQDREGYHRRSSDRTPNLFAVIDVDSFKKINDNYGDSALIKTAQHLKSTLRSNDIIGRMGGDEFAVVLPSTPLDAGVNVLRRFARTAADGGLIAPKQGMPTFSIGVAEFEPIDRFDIAYSRADVAAYLAKNEGGNRIKAVSLED
jgi:diguanylate cyclase (GGDEF)-like protein